MRLLDLTLDTPAANLALDEALLDACASGELPGGGVLRLWEAPTAMVVVGRATPIADEVELAACRRHDVPVLRRVSGGMSIVAGPGCLMYAVVDRHPQPGGANIDAVHRHVLQTMVTGLRATGLRVEAAGTSDLATVSDDGMLRKVSGNSLRIMREAFLYHGTLLYDFDLPLIHRYLRPPPRSPEYRAGRAHGKFVANLPISREPLRTAIADAWRARENLSSYPHDRVRALVETRYTADAWNLSR